jgi:hypothetical protein
VIVLEEAALANTNNPFGFRQYGQREGSAPTAGMERAWISSAYTTPVFTGDAVVRSTTPNGAQYLVSGGSSQGTGATTLGASVAVNQGIFLGCKYYNSNVGRTVWNSYWPGSGASGDVEVYVCTNPEQLYTVQSTSGAVLGSSNIGMILPQSTLLSSQGNTLTGISNMTVTSSLVTGLSSGGQWMIVDVYSNVAPPGVNGTSTTAEGLQIVVVQPNSAMRRTLYGVGGGLGVAYSS